MTSFAPLFVLLLVLLSILGQQGPRRARSENMSR